MHFRYIIDWKALFLTLALACFLVPDASSQNHSVKRIEVDAVLHKDGSAEITQYWEVSVTTGTEWYVPVQLLDNMAVSDLTVSEDGRKFVTTDTWVVNRDITEKFNRCGIRERSRNNVELCWGIGNYGPHRWKVSFRITGLVQSYKDYDGFNYEFINTDNFCDRESATVSITAPSCGLTSSNTRVWSSGFAGDADLLPDGTILAAPDGILPKNSNMTVTCRFDKGIFFPDMSRQTFFYKVRQNRDADSTWKFFLLLFVPVLAGLGWIIFDGVVLGRKYRKSIYGRRKIDVRWPDIPLEGRIGVSFFIYRGGWRFGADNSEMTVIGATFLKWILAGVIKVQADPAKPSRIIMHITGKDPMFENEVERVMYEQTLEVAGKSMKLTAADFGKWTSRHHSSVENMRDLMMNDSMAWLKSRNILESPHKATPQGRPENLGVIALKNYLTDFVEDDNPEMLDRKRWNEYLIFAQLFGIAEDVVAKLREIAPAEFEEYCKELEMDSVLFATMISNVRGMSARAFLTPDTRKNADHRFCHGCRRS